jgi:hypothetical protein
MEVLRNITSPQGGYRKLWVGLVPTLWRDVPFSAIYWTLYEFILENNKINFWGRYIKENGQSEAGFMAHFSAGALAGTQNSTQYSRQL